MVLKFYTTLIALFLFQAASSQNVAINDDGSAPSSCAMLDVSSTSKGLLIPRVSLLSTTDVATIASPLSGLMVYNTNAGMTNGSIGFWYYNGSAFVKVEITNRNWSILGNTSTTASTASIGNTVNNNFIGNTDAIDLVFATTNLERMRIASGGNVGIGVVVPSEALSFNGDALKRIAMERHTTSNTAGNFLTIKSGGATSGATDKNGGTLNLSSGISTGTGSSSIAFFTATAGSTGTTDNSSTQKMVIMGSGNVGLGLTAPATILNVRKSTAAVPATSGTTSTAIARFDAQNNALDIGAYPGSPYGNWIQATAVADLSTEQPIALNPNGGYIGIGTAAPASRLEIVNDAGSGADDDFGIKSYSSSLSPQIFMQTAAGTAASPTNLSNGADLGSISWWGQISSAGSLLSRISSTLTGSGTNGKTDIKFYTSGTEHIRVDSIGRVMIACNTTSFAPKTSFHMYGDGTSGYALGGTTLLANPSEGPEIAFGRGGFSTNPGASIQFVDYDSYSGGLAFLVHKGTQNNGGGTFADNWPTDVIQAMTIVNNGQIGIGTSDPTAIFHTIASGAKTAAYSGNLLTNTATSSTASVTKAGLEVTSTGTWNGTTASNIGIYVSSVTGGTSNYDAIFNGGGNVGIGTTAPNAKLQVNGTFALTTATSGTANTVIFLSTGTFSTPTASSSNSGVIYIIRNTSTATTVSVNSVVPYASTSASTFSLTAAIGSITIISDGTKWYRIH